MSEQEASAELHVVESVAAALHREAAGNPFDADRAKALLREGLYCCIASDSVGPYAVSTASLGTSFVVPGEGVMLFETFALDSVPSLQRGRAVVSQVLADLYGMSPSRDEAAELHARFVAEVTYWVEHGRRRGDAA